MSYVPVLVALVILAAVGSALVTAIETALFSLGESRVRTLLGEGFRGSDALESLRSSPAEPFILLRLAKSGADAAAGLLAGALGYLLGGIPAAAGAVIAVAILLLLLGQLLPIRLAAGGNIRIALAAARPLLWLTEVSAPALRILEPLIGGMPRQPVSFISVAPEEEVRQLTEIGRTEGVVEEDERQLIERVFRLDETRARDITTPRVDIFAWEDTLTLDSIASQLPTVPYSRVPVFRESVDQITGVLYIRDAYQALLGGGRELTIGALAREPLIVPGSLPLTRLLRDFQSRRIHLAVVVDEYGGTDGLVTLEDVLEELVGEIVDETDIAEEPMVRTSRNQIIASGDADLREINHFFNTSFPLLEHRSLNGYLLEELGRVPEEGERLTREGIGMEILEASETQILRARLERVATVSEVAEASSTAQEGTGGRENG